MVYKPKLDDFDLELIGAIDTGIEKDIVEYETPFADGAVLDDMGAKARRWTINTIWRAANYERHRDFIEHAEKEQLNSFVHPELGMIRGRIKSVKVIHDSRLNCAEISIEFIEDKNPDVVPTHNPPLESALEKAFAETISAMTDCMADDLADNDIDASVEINPDESVAEQVSTKTVRARSMIARLSKALVGLDKAFDTALNPIDSAVGAYSYALNFPGMIVKTIARAVERAARTANSSARSPSTALSNLRDAINRLCNATPDLAGYIRISGASIGAMVVGKVFADDESLKNAVRRIEDTQMWRPDGTLIEMPPSPRVLSANDLDDSLARIRKIIQDGIDAARKMGSTAVVSALARQAADLTRYTGDVKAGRDVVRTVEIHDATPLHLICLQHGLPYQYADRICTINDFQCPTFCRGAVRIYERRR